MGTGSAGPGRRWRRTGAGCRAWVPGLGIRDSGLGIRIGQAGSGWWRGRRCFESPIPNPESPLLGQRLCQRAAVRIDHPRVPARTVLRGALLGAVVDVHDAEALAVAERPFRSEENTTDLQALMRISY